MGDDRRRRWWGEGDFDDGVGGVGVAAMVGRRAGWGWWRCWLGPTVGGDEKMPTVDENWSLERERRKG